MREIPAFWSGAMALAGHVDLFAIAEALGGWESLLKAGTKDLVSAGVRDSVARAWLGTPARITRGEALTLLDPRYPQRLRAVPFAPAVVCVEGDVAVLDTPRALAVVGTRSCTPYGSGVARHLAGAAASDGTVVVSGLARGVDGHAHRSALKAGRTIAVLAHGLDFTAPSHHQALRDKIVDNGGLLLTTHGDDVAPRPYLFPRRNRWIAAMSDAVVVVEAGKRSGALHTARAALELGRDVVAVPGPIGSATSAGCNQLLAQGAQVLTGVEEFLASWSGTEGASSVDWLDALTCGGSLDDASRQSGRPVSELLCELAQLELAGVVVRLPGQRYARNGGRV